uniref:SLBP_RNA_bind domain-containing protein n=1 Tax=Steinernema glaseri TaxID=37863 RepID=A0A1I7YL53_9BILA
MQVTEHVSFASDVLHDETGLKTVIGDATSAVDVKHPGNGYRLNTPTDRSTDQAKSEYRAAAKMSGRKWASPSKKAKKEEAEHLNNEEFPPLDLASMHADLGNKSWAEIVTESENNAASKVAEEETSGRRRKALPKKADPKPRFLKTHEEERQRNVVIVQSESSKGLQVRKRKMSTSSVSTVDEEEHASPRKRTAISRSVPRKSARSQQAPVLPETPKRGPRRLCSSASSSPAMKKREDWEEPTLGWCTDEEVLKRRTREIERAKEKTVYERYLQEIPKEDRVKGLHPRTPNKLINYSRRSWDSLVRRWKRALYDWAGEEPSESTRTSRCSSRASSVADLTDSALVKEKENEPSESIGEVNVAVRPEADAMASLLGHFQVDSRQPIEEDESTLKAPSTGNQANGPVDFSGFQ